MEESSNMTDSENEEERYAQKVSTARIEALQQELERKCEKLRNFREMVDRRKRKLAKLRAK